jgi:hypothetical protein
MLMFTQLKNGLQVSLMVSFQRRYGHVKMLTIHFLRLSVVKHLSILIKKIEQNLKKNPRSVPLLDTVLMILVISYGIMKMKKSLGA